MDPISMVVYHMNQIKKDGAFEDKKCHSGGYQCWLQIQFIRKAKDKRVSSYSQMVWLHHGRGGGATVTKGMIDGNRTKVSNVFDVGVVGHKHTHIHDTDRYTYLDDHGSIKRRYRDFFVVGGYNGAEIVQDPDRIDEDSIYPRGMDLDYSETFYNNQGQGSVRVEFIPKIKEGLGWVKRRITTDSQSIAP
jgi:hypothetical protein